MSPGWSHPLAPFILLQMSSPKSARKLTPKAQANLAKPAVRSANAVISAAVPGQTANELPVSAQTATQVIEHEKHLCNLLDAIVQQDQAALGTFYDMTVSRVYGVALRIVRHTEMAEEVVSDVYMQVWRNAARYDDSRGRVLGWLLIIARSRALDALRRQDEAFSHPEPHQLIDEPEDNGRGPQDLLLATESSAELHRALQTLTPLQRQLLSLAFFKGLSHSEIADHTAIPLGSVKTQIRRALTTLREALVLRPDSTSQQSFPQLSRPG
jgi:RNA polymerase sigma factor (sigma-70 family)